MKISIMLTALLFAIAAGTFNPAKQPQINNGNQPEQQDTISVAIAAIEMGIKEDIKRARVNARKNTVAVKKISIAHEKQRNCCFFIDSINKKSDE